MTNDSTLIVAVLDRSGSMHSIANDTNGGFNAFIAEQRETAGDVRVTLNQFDDQFETVFSDLPIDKVKPLHLVPRGMTALQDAIGRTITQTGELLAAKAEEDRPGSVIVLVMTDGYENCSREYSVDTVKDMIKHQEDVYNWKFIFLGANIDAVTVGSQYGFDVTRTATYGANTAGVTRSFATTSGLVTNLRTGMDAAFSDTERSAMLGN